MRVHRFGSGSPRVMMLHGFTQHGGHMREAAQFFGHACIAPDLPGHGPEPHLPATMDEAVERVVALGEGIEALVGYSMGGRVALRAAQQLPDLKVLVLISATAGLGDEERPARAAADSALADRFEAEPLESMVDEWLAKPLFTGMANRSARWRERDRALRLEGTGPGLAASLRGMGQGSVQRVSDEEVASLSMVVECVAGGADEPYVQEAERMAVLMPRGIVRIHSSAGHSLLAEDPGFGVRSVRLLLL